jgi:hypothetical protein
MRAGNFNPEWGYLAPAPSFVAVPCFHHCANRRKYRLAALTSWLAFANYVWPRDDADWYVEPTWCSIRLFAVESFVGHVHDPAAGMGRIVEAARAHGLPATGADIVARSFGFMVQDFALATEPVDNIVTNPPFALARQFVDHALELARRKIAILFPIARLNAARWLEDTPFRQLWLLTPRPSMPPGEMILREFSPRRRSPA